MNSGRFAAHASVVALALALSACGGGGSGGPGSTPNPPAPTPTPGTPTPTPTPTPAPTPVPTPTPTPVALNDDLFAPLVSESFSNTAAEIGGDYQSSGDIEDQYARRASLSFSYNASTMTYTVSEGGVSQQFGPADINEQDASSIVYLREDENRADSLLLTKPGNSGALTYRYVGAGFWQRTVTDVDSAQIDIRAFTYGVETPAGSVPTAGKASYDVDVIALGGYEQYVGNGGITVDFASAQLLFSVPLLTVLLDGTTSDDGLIFSGAGTVDSGNSFSGSFSLTPHLVTNGTLEGMFYGPAAEEIGASFFAPGFAGTMTGRKGGGSTLANTTATIINQGMYASHDYIENDGPDTVVSFAHYDYETNRLTYDGASKSFSVDNPDWAGSFGPSDKIASSDSRFDVYQRSDGTVLRVFKASQSNPDVKLTYLSFTVFERAPSSTGSGTEYRYVYNDWGLQTETMPRSGTASYGGRLYGIATNEGRIYDLTGQAQFTMNFGAATWTGTLSPVGTVPGTSQSYSFAPLSASGSISLSNEFGGMTAGATMQLSGHFYGPSASELGATFTGELGIDPAGGGLGMVGAGVIVATLK